MTNETLNYLLLLSPVAIGGIIAVLNSEDVNTTTEKAEAWTRKTQANAVTKNGSYNFSAVYSIQCYGQFNRNWKRYRFFDRFSELTVQLVCGVSGFE